ncbi:chaperone modulator CbpM [Roseomonas chloroacetimidivorans]|uniref:chaperone modulator CbpM n=1 Tax=Roseomonas chloroacetimidivorans TaxID=1766656 RepID=UPI003C781C31
MITIEALCRTVVGLDRSEVERWIENAWLHAEGTPGHYLFREIDVARVRLIHELRTDLKVEEETLPVVLSLVDQLYEARRRYSLLCAALNQALPDEAKLKVISALEGLWSVRPVAAGHHSPPNTEDHAE